MAGTGCLCACTAHRGEHARRPAPSCHQCGDRDTGTGCLTAVPGYPPGRNRLPTYRPQYCRVIPPSGALCAARSASRPKDPAYPRSDGRLGKRCTTCRSSCCPSKRARMTRPLSAPRSTAATLRVTTSLFPSSTWIRRRDATIDIEHIAGTLGGTHRRSEEGNSLGDISRVDIDPQRRPFAVYFFELIGGHAVSRRAFLPPGAVPDTRPGQHCIWIDRVDANAKLSALFGQATRQVRFGSLGRRIRRNVLARDQRVLAGNEDQVAPTPLSLQKPEAFARHQEVAGRQHVPVLVPLCQARFGDW